MHVDQLMRHTEEQLMRLPLETLIRAHADCGRILDQVDALEGEGDVCGTDVYMSYGNLAIELARCIIARRAGARKVFNVCTCSGLGRMTVGDITCPHHGRAPEENAYWEFELTNGKPNHLAWLDGFTP